MSAASPEPSIAGLSLGGSTAVDVQPTSDPANSTRFQAPSYASFPPFYTLQPNLTTRARQLELWSSLVTSYCAYHRLFRLSLSALPADLFANPSIGRSLKPADIRAIIDYMSQPSNGPSAEWIAPTARGETSNTCYIYWKTPAEWADLIYAFVEDTGQKGAVLTIYELREGESSLGREWKDIDEALLRKVLNVLVKRGKAQVFGQEENAGLPVRGKEPASGHSGKRRSRKSTVGEESKPLPKRQRAQREAQHDSVNAIRERATDHESGNSRVTLYDAVAGRVGYEGLLHDKGGKPLPPDQVLYSRAGAPVRYAENDPYFAHRQLPQEERLPDSDMLKAIHAYVADYYGSTAQRDSRDDFRSLDETALLAFGILLEEAATHSLKETGDLAYVEGVQKDQLH